MLYLDYSREPGEWIPNVHGGRENLDAIHVPARAEHGGLPRPPRRADLRRGVDRVAHGVPARPTSAASASASSGTWAGCTTRCSTCNATRSTGVTTTARSRSASVYAWSENFVLPLSHDEVVHGKGSLARRRCPATAGSSSPTCGCCSAASSAQPGKKLLFMGAELARRTRVESRRPALDWSLLDQPAHAGIATLGPDLQPAAPRARRRCTSATPSPRGFEWLESTTRDESVFTFLRWTRAGDAGARRAQRHAGRPHATTASGSATAGPWREVLEQRRRDLRRERRREPRRRRPPSSMPGHDYRLVARAHAAAARGRVPRPDGHPPAGRP